jgi:AbrB family looped-hinge helix DNA binding protein
VNAFTLKGQLDSKGRLTVPAEIRENLGLESGDQISVTLESSSFIRKKFDSKFEAIQFLSELENFEKFNFDGEILEVVISE